MKNYSVDRQNYRIFKTDNTPDSPYVHFFWGKFDFRMSFEVFSDSSSEMNAPLLFSGQGKKYKTGTLELLHHHQWYQFIKPTGHGLVLEETLWEKGEEKHYVEFPRDLSRICRDICAEELGFKPIIPATNSE